MKQRIAADTKQYGVNRILRAHTKPTIYQTSKIGGKNLTSLIIHEQRTAADAKQYWFEPNTAHTKTNLTINETEYS
jgi:hypothetical protein